MEREQRAQKDAKYYADWDPIELARRAAREKVLREDRERAQRAARRTAILQARIRHSPSLSSDSCEVYCLSSRLVQSDSLLFYVFWEEQNRVIAEYI